MIQQITISVEAPAGYEATGEYREASPGEPFLTLTGGAQTIHNNDQCGRKGKRIILRKQWAFPAWFKNGWWLYNCGSNRWAACELQPICPPNVYWEKAIEANRLWEFHGETFVAPPVPSIQCVR